MTRNPRLPAQAAVRAAQHVAQALRAAWLVEYDVALRPSIREARS
jgi:hypothetical protein